MVVSRPKARLWVALCTHAVDSRDTAVILATLSRQLNEELACIDAPHVLIPEVVFTTSRISSSASWSFPIGNVRCKISLVPTFADREVLHSHCGESPTAIISVYRPESLLFLSSSSSIVLMSLSGPRSRPTTSQKNW
jgi:hypothetical protein